MTYPKRKKLTEYPITNAALTDLMVNVSQGQVKLSSIATIRDVVQANLAQATETFAGVSELATQTETNLGTDDTRIVTPVRLETNFISRIANQHTAEAAGDSLEDPSTLNDTKVMTPKKWRQALNKFLTSTWSFDALQLFSYGINLLSPGHVPENDGEIWIDGKLKTRIDGNTLNVITTADVATASVAGVIKTSTIAQAIAGTDSTVAITPFVLKYITYDASNVATGATNATLNQLNGLITYTGDLNASTMGTYVLYNNLITTNSVIEWFINGESFQLINCSYHVQSGQITFNVYNIGGTTATEFKVNYRIIG